MIIITHKQVEEMSCMIMVILPDIDILMDQLILNHVVSNENLLSDKIGSHFLVSPINTKYIMKSILILFFTSLIGLLYSQEQDSILPNKFGFIIYRKPTEVIVSRLEELEKYSLDKLTLKSKWSYHLAVSSYKLYLGRDSALYHFYEAYKLYPGGTCVQMQTRHDAFIKALAEGKKTGIEDAYIKTIKKETGKSRFSWYLWDLADFEEFAFIDSCNKKFPPKKANLIVKDSTLNSEIISKRDQKYRLIGDMKEQQKLDQINRDFIDSLYSIKGSLKAFDEDEVYQISMVTHHSDDCDWVYKWTERLIELYNNGYHGNSLLGPLLDRMFDDKEGYCTKQDTQKRDYFISMMKTKYPEYVKKIKL